MTKQKATSDMYITSLHAKNVRLFNELDVQFNKGFNFIVGPNGSGKTSILRCLAMCVTESGIEDSRFGKDTEVWTNLICNNKCYRIGFGPGWAITKTYRNPAATFLAPPTTETHISFTPFQIDEYIPTYVPLFIGAYRKVDYCLVTGTVREEMVTNQRVHYRRISPNSLNGSFVPAIKQWMVNRYFQIEKSWAVEERRNWEWLLQNFNHISPVGSDFGLKEIKRDLEPIFLLNEKECYLEELSSGFQAVLSMVLSIFQWIELTNEVDSMYVKNAVGTVIIDELDVHLHPEWQLTLRDSLEKIFPNIQFIITTHSPHLIAAAKQGEVIIIPEHNGHLSVKPTNKMYSGWNTDQILADIMGVKSLENKVYAQMIKNSMELVKQKDIKGLKMAISSLESITHPSDTIVSILKIELASLLLQEREGHE